MFAASVPLFRQMLGSLSKVLEKGAAFAEARKIEPSVLLQARLAPDMFPLAGQVRLACDNAKGGVARLAGVDSPKFADDENSFAELQERIIRTLGFFDSIEEDQVDGSEEKAILLKMRGGELHLKGLRYLTGFAIPNVLFHCTTAYAILRHNGVDLGKRDFIGAL
jgi:hypothetical protein